MRVTINDVEYTLSMKWNQDDTAQFFVQIDGEWIELNSRFYKDRNDSKTHINNKQLRELVTLETKNILDSRTGDRRS